MKHVYIYVVGFQSRKAVLYLSHNVISTQTTIVWSCSHGSIHFRGKNLIVSLTLKRPADYFFGMSIVVAVGRIDKLIPSSMALWIKDIESASATVLPKIMVPKHRRETFSPDLPKLENSIIFLL